MRSRNSVYLDQKGPKLFLVILSVLFVLMAPTSGRSKTHSDTEEENLVRQLVAAFNERNVPRMFEVLDEDIQWLSIGEDKITIEASGKKSLQDRMTSYFRQCKSCKSSLDWIQRAGNRVLAMERATWISKTGPKSQTSLSIYEFRNHRILRVYYLPAEEIDGATILSEEKNVKINFSISKSTALTSVVSLSLSPACKISACSFL